MKIKLLFPLIILLHACGSKTLNDPKVILEKANEKCQGIQNGYYEMTIFSKNMTAKDTTMSNYRCHFKKLSNDTLFPVAFHYKAFVEGKYNVDELYTGNELVSMNIKDSTAEITKCNRWAGEINSYAHNYIFYSPFTHKDGLMLMQDTDLAKPSNIYKLIGIEK